MKLNIKQKSILWYFIDAAEATGPSKINQLCRLTLSSKLNIGEEFPKIVESFLDCNASQIKEKCENFKKQLF
jgi:hypothetical protein